MAARNFLESQPLSGLVITRVWQNLLDLAQVVQQFCAGIGAAMRTSCGALSAYSWRIAETRVRAGGIDGLQVHDPTPRTAIADPGEYSCAIMQMPLPQSGEFFLLANVRDGLVNLVS